MEITISNPSRMHGEHSISRVLYRLHGDDYLSSHPIAWMIKRRNPEGQRAASTLPYSVLLQMGFTKPAGLPTAGALLPHLSTLTCNAGGISLLHFPWGRPRRPLAVILLCEARTFLIDLIKDPRSCPACSLSIYCNSKSALCQTNDENKV